MNRIMLYIKGLALQVLYVCHVLQAHQVIRGAHQRVVSMLLFMSVVLITASCHRRPLLDSVTERYVRVYLNTEIQNVNTGLIGDKKIESQVATRAGDNDDNSDDLDEQPQELTTLDDFADYVYPELIIPPALVVMFCDTLTGHVVTERFLRNQNRDDIGLYFDGTVLLPPGEYNMLVENFGLESITINDERDFYSATAIKNSLSPFMMGDLPQMSQDDGRCVYTPDLLFLCTDRVVANLSQKVDTLVGIQGNYFMAQSVVHYYFMQIKVSGLGDQGIKSVSGLLSGVVGGLVLSTGELTDENVQLYFDMYHTDPINGEAIVYVTFPAFGYIPGMENELKLLVEVTTTDNRKVIRDIDVTEELLAVGDEKQIFLEDVIEIPEPTPSDDSGFMPQIIQWQDVETDVII